MTIEQLQTLFEDIRHDRLENTEENVDSVFSFFCYNCLDENNHVEEYDMVIKWLVAATGDTEWELIERGKEAMIDAPESSDDEVYHRPKDLAEFLKSRVNTALGIITSLEEKEGKEVPLLNTIGQIITYYGMRQAMDMDAGREWDQDKCFEEIQSLVSFGNMDVFRKEFDELCERHLQSLEKERRQG